MGEENHLLMKWVKGSQLTNQTPPQTDRFNEHRRPILNPSGSYIQNAVSEYFLNNSHSVSHSYLSHLKHLDMNAIVLGKHVRRTSFIKPKQSSLWEWTNVKNSNNCVIFVFFSVYFSQPATSYPVISIYSVYSWFFLINLMKTGIGQSKYCIPQPFTCCLISLCSSLVDFDSILNSRQTSSRKLRTKIPAARALNYDEFFAIIFRFERDCYGETLRRTTAIIRLACHQALHLGEAREVAREQHAKEDASARDDSWVLLALARYLAASFTPSS